MAGRFDTDPDIIRGRDAADRVKAQGGDAFDATLAFIRTAFDEVAAARQRKQRAVRIPAIVRPDDEGAQRTAVVIDSLPRRHP